MRYKDLKAKVKELEAKLNNANKIVASQIDRIVFLDSTINHLIKDKKLAVEEIERLEVIIDYLEKK